MGVMSMPRLWLWMVAGCLMCGSAHAQPVQFACPKAGTVEQRGLGKITYTGPSPSDPYLCTSLNYANRPQALLFNFYIVDDSSKAAVRTAMIDLLSGAKTSVSFDFTTPRDRYFFHHTWTFLRREHLTIDGWRFNTIVFDEETQQTNGAELHGHFTRWLDPVNGLWLRSRFKYVSGQMTGGVGGYSDVSITLR
jgi:hypothetical protein